MKEILHIMIICVFTYGANAQDQFEITVPVKTSHFYSKQFKNLNFVEGEGGDVGLLVSYINGKRTLKDNYTIGTFRNSYGKWSMMGTYGKRWFFTNSTSIGLNIGFATNYKDAYYKKRIRATHAITKEPIIVKESLHTKQKALDLFYRNSIQPLLVFQFNQRISRVLGVGFVLNPYHITITANMILK